MDEEHLEKKKSDPPPSRKRVAKIKIPRRDPSIVPPARQKVYPTPDKTTCALCTCYPKEEPYSKRKKLNPCQQTPPTLYELAALVVDQLPFPKALEWSVGEVAEWITTEVGLPQYKECILDNQINGMRLLMLENPWHMPYINIHDFDHIKRITWNIRALFGTEIVRFARSIALTPRKPLTHCTSFKSRTGPSWGIRTNWSRSDILRWMKVLMSAPSCLDHWDSVWYHEPDFPKLMFARIPKAESRVHIPRYVPREEVCKEYMVPRKFRLQTCIPEEAQMIWMERQPEKTRQKIAKLVKAAVPKECRLLPKRVSLSGLTGKDLILARRKMPKPKFLV